MATRIGIKSIKVSIPIDLADFPIQIIPPPGTPGGKNMAADLTLHTPEGVEVRFSLSGAKLMTLGKIIASSDANAGGYVVVQGRMAKGVLLEAGVVYQPKKAPQAAQQAA
jgi:hypothetical protein